MNRTEVLSLGSNHKLEVLNQIRILIIYVFSDIMFDLGSYVWKREDKKKTSQNYSEYLAPEFFLVWFNT